MITVDLSRVAWRKSSQSAQSNNCVEVALVGPVTAVRDSKDPASPALVFGRTQWSAFLHAAKTGALTQP
jgi:hypothetical protein